MPPRVRTTLIMSSSLSLISLVSILSPSPILLPSASPVGGVHSTRHISKWLLQTHFQIWYRGTHFLPPKWNSGTLLQGTVFGGRGSDGESLKWEPKPLPQLMCNSFIKAECHRLARVSSTFDLLRVCPNVCRQLIGVLELRVELSLVSFQLNSFRENSGDRYNFCVLHSHLASFNVSTPGNALHVSPL